MSDVSDTFLRDCVFSLGAGVVFGVAFNKSGLADPKVVRENLRLERWTAVKTFLTAVATGAAAVSVSNMLGLTVVYIRPSVTPSDILGGALMGTGLYLTGATPETVFGQIGNGKEKALWALLGGVAGALTYESLQPTIIDRFPQLLARVPLVRTSELMGVSFVKIGIPLALAAGGLAYALEQLFPESIYRDRVVTETDDGAGRVTLVTYLRKKVWSPWVGGAVLGILQIPCLVLVRVGLGGSSSYVTLGAHLASLFGRVGPSLRLNMGVPRVYYQMMLDCGIVLGSWLAAKKFRAEVKGGVTTSLKDATGPTIPQPIGKPTQSLTPEKRAIAILGGFALLLGARAANTCTSAHSVLGAPQLSCTSMIAIAAMFGTGAMMAAQMGKRMK